MTTPDPQPDDRPPALHLGWWVTIVLFLLIFVLPIERYRPACDGDEGPEFEEGPLRGIYADLVAERLDAQGYFHLRIGDEIYVRRAYPHSILHNNYTSRDYYFRTDDDIRTAMREGRGAHGKPIEPPALGVAALTAARREHAETEAYMEAHGELPPGHSGRNLDCEYIHAFFVAVEDTPPEKRMRIVPRVPLLPMCRDVKRYANRSFDSLCDAVVYGSPETAR